MSARCTPWVLLSCWALLGAPSAWAGLQPEAYGETVRLIDSLYLHPEDIDADRLIVAAARGLADEVDWLLVEVEGSTVYLHHGDGTAIGSLTVASMETLPEALAALEDLVLASGYSVRNVDVRLAILSGLTRGLDRYSTVLAGDRLDRFDVRLKGTLVGVGLTVRLDGDALRVVELVEDGPAARGGLQIGDRVVRIDGISTVNMPIREASRRIRGEPDSVVVFTLQRDGRTLDVPLVREEVVVPNVQHEVLDEGVGYVRITHFSQRTDENLRAALQALRDLDALGKGLVIDLRGNTGGSMKDSARSADEFVHEGMLLRTAGPDGGRVRNLQSRMDAVSLGTEPDVPVVILMDGRTASGSEIMAGALVELDRAALVGARSFGKGTVQKVYPIDPDARLKLTVARYLLANDRAITEQGLTPDLALADVVLDSDGMRFRRFDEDDTGVPFESVVPVIVERESWRGLEPVPVDARLEVARRAVLRTQGPRRDALLVALAEAGAELRTEQAAHLAEALGGRAIDWTAGPAPARALPVPRADVRVRVTPDSEDPDSLRVQVEVANRGTLPLEQALVELDCATFSPWRGVAVPLGRIAPGATAMGQHRVRLTEGVLPREDEVVPTLRAAHRPPLMAPAVVLQARSSPAPRIAISARYLPGLTSGRVEVTVNNLTSARLEGIEVAFAHPGDVDLELVDHAARVPSIMGRRSARVDLQLRPGEGAPARLPLQLTVAADQVRGLLADWPLQLPLDGTVVSLEAPRIHLDAAPPSAPVGSWKVPLSVSDETRLDHVVVYANGEKVGWAPGGAAHVTFDARMVLVPGENQLVVVATDEHGVVARERVQIRGEVAVSVDAGEGEAGQ